VFDFDEHRNVVGVAALPRPALKITVAYEGTEVDLINVHLKSKLLTFPGGLFSTQDEELRANVAHFALQRRAAEATTIRRHATDLMVAGRNVAVLGDMNDGTEAATTAVLYGPAGSQPKGPEDATADRGAFQLQDKMDLRRLFNVTKLVPADIRWSRKYQGELELIDHILASEGLMPRVGDLRQVPAMSILNADATNIDDYPRNQDLEPDHAPVTAGFQI
jgi:predicted extracellular nuclease